MLAHDAVTAAPTPLAWVPPVLLVVVPTAAYVLAARRRVDGGRPWPALRTVSFTAGALLVGVATSPALESFAHADPRGHMAQHLLLGMFAPLGLVLGAPLTLLLPLLPVAARRPVSGLLRSGPLHVLAHPVTAAALTVGGLYALYLTPLYAVSTEVPAVHHLVHVHFLLAGYLFTWAVAGPDPAPRRPGTTTRVTVLVLAAGAHAHLAKLLYSRAGELPPGSGHGVAEVEQAAQWMYYGGDLAEVLLAVALFSWWYRRRGRRSALQRALPGGGLDGVRAA